MSRRNDDSIGCVNASAWTEETAGPDDEGRRLDRILRLRYPDLPLSALHRMFRTGDVRVGGRRAKPDLRVAAGDRIGVRIAAAASPDAGLRKPEAAPSLPSGMELCRDRGVLYLNKPRGILVHDGEESLESMVRRAFPDAGAGSLAFTPGPLHRLDRNTSGVIAFSLSLSGAHRFLAALRAGQVEKRYIAVLDGDLRGGETWRDFLVRDGERRVSAASGDPERGDTALTHVYPLANARGRTLALIRIETGRTHQIRAQAARHGHPLSGDGKYGSPTDGPYLLHALSLVIRQAPAEATADPEPPLRVVAPLPDYFAAALRGIFGLDQASVLLLADRASARGAS